MLKYSIYVSIWWNSEGQLQNTSTIVTPAADQFCTEHFEKLSSTNHVRNLEVQGVVIASDNDVYT